MRLAHDPSALHAVSDPREFGKVAVMLGGLSSEREVSLLTGQAVLAALLKKGVDAHAVDPKDIELSSLLDQRFDRVWIALHGPGGEDGTLQGALECLGLPYTGSGVLGSALCMDKVRTKRLAAAVGISTADFMVLRGPSDFESAVARLGLPMFVKPATQGSSVGISKVERAADLAAAYAAAAATDDVVLAEAFIPGAEYTVGVLHGKAMPSIRIATPKTFYDYEAKYLRSDTVYDCPSGLSAETERHLGALAVGAFAAVGAEGWGRVDFMMDATSRPLLLEINTVPGMTDHSLVPMAARASGIPFETLVWRVLETSLTRQRRD
ncbi:MAG: D-alanine--D-alanine ligase [Gammaproteobacteria bacterium]|nr:D-alanine--D-alanine ligase [Gammaproteobacteria bacterium]